MKILFNFSFSLITFIYGINLFSKGLKNSYQENIKLIIKKYTSSPFKGIILGGISTAIFQSSSLITITILNLVNLEIITFHNSLGLIMGANLGTCITSFLVSSLSIKRKNLNFLFNPISYIPLLIIIGIYFYFKKKKNKSEVLIGFSLFMLSLVMIKESLKPLENFFWFKKLLLSLNSPLLGVISGFLTTCIIQSSSATIAILQTLSINNKITFQMAIPIIMGENIGTCITALIASINTSKNAKKVSLANLLYNFLGTIIFLFIFYFLKFLKLPFLEHYASSFGIAIIHTLFNLFSIFIFLPFLNKFERLINHLVK